MRKKIFEIRLTGILLFFSSCLAAQEMPEIKKPIISFGNGVGLVSPDSLFSLNFRFRMQSRAAYSTISESNFSASEIEARVRRMRIRIDGFVVNPKISYYIQLSFSRGDMDWNVRDNSNQNSSPNVLRDAIVSYKATKNLTFVFGQTKLPGNRQRVVSSGELQFADRSIVNSTFTTDRDFGLHAIYQNQLSNFAYILKTAISSGEGRNSLISDAGLAYTGRIELLPFGKFTNKGDYFEGDIEREQSPKLSLAGGYHFNENAVRSAGTLGKDLYQARNLHGVIADGVFKFKGLAISAEYINRYTDNPITINELLQERIIYVGEGKLAQISYLFPNNYEIAGRYAIVTPLPSIYKKASQKEEAGLGITKYLNNHRVKVQGNLFYLKDKNLSLNSYNKQNWAATFQIELGI